MLAPRRCQATRRFCDDFQHRSKGTEPPAVIHYELYSSCTSPFFMTPTVLNPVFKPDLDIHVVEQQKSNHPHRQVSRSHDKPIIPTTLMSLPQPRAQLSLLSLHPLMKITATPLTHKRYTSRPCVLLDSCSDRGPLTRPHDSFCLSRDTYQRLKIPWVEER